MQPLPRGKRVAVLGSGGQCVAIADACSALGLELPELDDNAKRDLMQILPPHAPVPTNPVDTVASGIKMTIPRLTEVLAKLDYIDGVITQGLWAGVYNTPSRLKHMVSEAEIVAAIPKKYGKPVVCIEVPTHFLSARIATDLYRHAGIPSYGTPEEAARAMWGLMAYGEIRRRLEGSE
jgi:acetyltransferase